jgi:hypothetical protein
MYQSKNRKSYYYGTACLLPTLCVQRENNQMLLLLIAVSLQKKIFLC